MLKSRSCSYKQSSAAPLTSLTLAGENKEGFQKLEPGPMLHIGTPIGAIRTQDIRNWKLPPSVKRILTPMNNPVIYQE